MTLAVTCYFLSWRVNLNSTLLFLMSAIYWYWPLQGFLPLAWLLWLAGSEDCVLAGRFSIVSMIRASLPQSCRNTAPCLGAPL